jgi:YebC/PmpR family DNA-binding regulatory protein
MGRAFEFRRGRKEKRWAQMSKAFTRYGKDIAMAVKAGGPDPQLNARLRVIIQNAKSVNMPKDRIEGAIKRASSKEEKDYEEMVYEGYGPYGVAILVETATDNPTRTVANIRSFFNRAGGTLGTKGSLDFIFERKVLFKVPAAGLDLEELELDLIDYGVDEIFAEDDVVYIYTAFNDFGPMQKALEDKGLQIISSEAQRIPQVTKKLTPEQEEEVETLVGKIEEDDDVQSVFHNME